MKNRSQSRALYNALTIFYLIGLLGFILVVIHFGWQPEANLQ